MRTFPLPPVRKPAEAEGEDSEKDKRIILNDFGILLFSCRK
ncbi:hypothetical protein BACCOPRO_03491 [Phocaeicola coprophilus DSM 18228 = JCM 13818]|uniref:Uncharacterized protein n=1 Tax=Phocaeicola coprophilus DSM 18228 = JCM 13818 TaxID=547042 RepID=S0FBX3_9BACT|nr:hypothetical protein BACCOPRO_03491 [Phocaeicola coprophilus DSM 18228 = JCM 13818]